MTFETLKGFKDYTGEEAEKREEITRLMKNIFESYGFEPAETPVIERKDFVEGNEGKKKKKQEQDEAISDIYKLKDKGKRDLALRYEFTFQLKRLMQNKKLPYKRYQLGYVFRDEPASTNRYRQFKQCDVDIVGISKNVPARDESEVLAIAKTILESLGIEFIILINNRKLLNEILKDNKVPEKYWKQVLREIDKYDKLPEKEIKKNLKKFKTEKVLEALKQGEEYFSKFDSYKEIISLMEYCKLYGFEVKFSPTVARGLSYYNGTVFEIKTKKMKETITAGGSFMFNDVQCTGISLGLDRLSSLAEIELQNPKTLIISLDQDKAAIKLANKLRKKGDAVSMYYGKPSKALEYAKSKSIDNVIFVGEKEVKAKKFKIKDMKTGKERGLKV